MGKLLRALGLQDPKSVPQELADPAQKIGDAEGRLGATQARSLKLKQSARQVAENLRDLDGRVEAALLAAKKAELVSLARRIADRDAADAGLVTDARELQMLLAETECALKDNKSHRKALQQARTSYAEALVARLDKSGDLAKDLKDYIDGHLADGNTHRVTAALKAIDELRNSADPRVAKASVDVADRMAKDALAQQKLAGASTAARDASRTPNDVLVHLVSTVNTALKTRDDKTLKALAAEGRKLFMGHSLDTAKVADLLDKASKAFKALKDDGLAGQCDRLKKQLPPSDDKLQATQLHDNLYGRVFDTKMVSTLVKDPPTELLAASGKSGAAFAQLLADSAANEEAAAYFVKHYIVEDQRPWSAAVPGFDALAKAKDGKQALAAVKQFLQTPPTTGQEIIAVSYLMAKLPQAQKNTGHEPMWFVNASGNYTRIISQANRERGATADKVVSKGAGITMLHQPDATGDDNLVESERPGTANRMGNRSRLEDDEELGAVKRSKQNEIQLKQALPFASGVSGTTNILLHLFEELEKQAGGTGTGVSPQEFLMNAMMFLVYDGGHSMHEAMWTANQIQADLKSIQFGLNDPSQKNEVNAFVSDYDRFLDQFTGELKKKMLAAQETAWQGTQEYLQKNSFFAE